MLEDSAIRVLKLAQHIWDVSACFPCRDIRGKWEIINFSSQYWMKIGFDLKWFFWEEIEQLFKL